MPKIFIITGKQGEGKTAKLINVVEKLKQNGFVIHGFFAEGYWSGNQRSGFDLVNIASNYRLELCKSESQENYFQLGRFYFNPEAIIYGENLLAESKHRNADLLVIDEIGRFELQGKLWADALTGLLKYSNNNLLITARVDFVEEIIEKFNFREVVIFNLNNPVDRIVKQISENFN